MDKRILPLVICCFASVQATMAEDAIEETSDTSRVINLEEVVVVSQPKDQFRLRLQPISSTIIGEKDMRRLGITDLRQLSQYVPSFTMPAYGSRYTSSMYVRGIGSRVNSPAVGVYLDNIPLVSKSMFNMYTYQLGRADVLRGPQGTLYGQNTEGGLVRLYSKDPMAYQGTDIHLSIGTDFTRHAELAHYNKVTNLFGFSLASFYDGQEGFFKNQTTGDYADKSDEFGGRLRLNWKPVERLSLGLLADYQHVSQNGFAYGLVDYENGKTALPATNRQGNYKRHLLTTGLSAEYHTDWAIASYVGSWQYLKDDMLMDIDYLPQDFMHMQQSQLQNAVTQELSLKSAGKSFWHWTFGAFFSHQAIKTNAPVYFDSEMNKFLSTTIEDYAYYGMLNSMANRMGMEAAKAMIDRAGGCHITMEIDPSPGLFRTPQNNYALFHESNFELNDRITATVGLRYDISDVSIDYSTNALMKLDENVMGTNVKASVTSKLEREESTNFKQLLPKVGIRYRLDKHNSNIYATITKGYRSGGYNFQMFSDILQTELQSKAQSARGDMTLEYSNLDYDNIRETIIYKPEESWNYELGTHLTLFDNRLMLDAAAYYIQIRNQQLSVMAGNFGFGRMMVNAGKSYSCGLELSLHGAFFDNRLQWMANYGFTRAVFKEYKDSVKIDGVNTMLDYKDNYVPFVPQHTFSAMADYKFKKMTIGANISGQGNIWWDEINSSKQQFYMTLGAHADYDFGTIVISLWGRNLTDTRYNTFAVQSSATGNSYQFAQRGNPLQVGLDVRIHL